MDYYNFDEPKADPYENRWLAGYFVFALALLGLGAYVNLRPAPAHLVHGYIVGRQWIKAHMSNKEPERVQQAGFVPIPSTYVARVPSPQPVPGKFTIWVANPGSVRPVLVDSATWFKLRCGQGYTYYYRPSWL